MPGVLLFFEKMFAAPNRKNMFFASAALIALFFGDLQITIFAFYYLLLRVGYYFLTNPKEKSFSILKRSIECLVLFAFVVGPILLSFAMLQDVGSLAVPTIPENYHGYPSEFFISGPTTDAPPLFCQ